MFLRCFIVLIVVQDDVVVFSCSERGEEGKVCFNALYVQSNSEKCLKEAIIVKALNEINY